MSVLKLNRIAPTPAADPQRVIMKHLLRLEVMIEERNLKIVREIRAVARSRPPASPHGSSPVPTDSPSSGTKGPVRVLRATDMKTRTIEHYCDLMDNLLACVNFEDYDIGIESRRRIRHDLVQVHKRETRYLDGIYGAEALKDAMTGKYWKLADMDGESYPLACTMHSQSSCSLPELAEEAAALEIAKAAETTETKPWDTKTSNTSPGDSILGGPKEVGRETSPQLLREEVEPLPEALFRPEVSITRISTSPKRLNSERLEAIDRKKWVSGKLSQSDGATRELSKCADPYDKGQRRKIATVENLDNCAVKILDQDTETREDLFEEVNPETMLTPLSRSGISKRLALDGGGYVEETDPLRRASIPLHNAHRKKLDPKFDSFVHSGAANLPGQAKSREPAVPLKEVAGVPQQAVNSRPPITHAQSLPLNYAMEVFLEDQWENPVTQKVAPDAGMPAPAWYEATSPDDSGTSVMVTQSSHTQKSVSTSQDLPGLTVSSESSASSQAGLSLAEDSDLDAVTILAPDCDYSAEDAEGTLECPFNQLGCLQAFADLKEWITHSLTHFGTVGPPTSNRCTFCEKQFHSFDAAQSWSERMNHVALHHRQGKKLTGSPWDNTVHLYTHMYDKGLLDINFLCEYLGRERDRRNVIDVVTFEA